MIDSDLVGGVAFMFADVVLFRVYKIMPVRVVDYRTKSSVISKVQL